MLRFPFFCVSRYNNVSRQHNEAGRAARESAPIVGWNIKSGRIKKRQPLDRREIVPSRVLFQRRRRLALLLLTVSAAQQAQSVHQPTHKRVKALSAPPRPLLPATCRALPPTPPAPPPPTPPSLLSPSPSHPPAFLGSSRVLLSFSARSLEGGVRLECQESLE